MASSNDPRVPVDLQQLARDIETPYSTDAQVEHNHVGSKNSELAHHFAAVGNGMNFLDAERPQLACEALPDQWMVVSDQHSNCHENALARQRAGSCARPADSHWIDPARATLSHPF
jgi:hypothetical protein